MPANRPLLVTASLALLVLTAGCMSAIEDDGSAELGNVTVEQLQEETMETMNDVETATFTMDMQMDLAGREVQMEGDGAMDVTNERMRMVMETEMFGETVEITQYVVGNTTYIQSQGQWQRDDVSDAGIWEQHQFEQQHDALEGADVTVTDTRTYEGHEVYVLDVRPDEQTLRELVQQPGANGDQMENVFDDVEIHSMELVQYVDTETYHVRYFEMDANMTVRGEEVTMSMTMSFDDFDEPVDIELPAEAEDAPRVGPTQ